MKKHVLIFITMIFSFTLFTTCVNAASATISVKSSVKEIVVGKTFKITVNISSKTAIGAWEYDLNYNKTYFELVGSTPSINIVDYATSSSIKSKSYIYTFQAKKGGSASFYVDSTNVIDFANEEKMSLTKSSVSVKAITQAELIASYSKDNYLKSLTVTGYELDKTFNKEETNYKVTVPTGTKSVELKASVNDSKSSVRGIGTIEVSEGINTHEIVVTAQNGSTKKYTIVIEVIDTNPIKVTVDKKEFTIVKNKEMLINPSNYELTTTIIEEVEVPCLQSESTGYTLVGLKDNDGNILLYIHDDSVYKKYQEIKSDVITIVPFESKEIVNNFKKYTLNINNDLITIYKFSEKSNVGLIYGMDVDTGKKNYYVYDIKNKTMQLYDNELNEYFTYLNQKHLYVIIGLSIVSFILLNAMLITFAKNNRNRKIIKILEGKQKLKEVKE